MPKILLVEDDLEFAAVLKVLLSRELFTVDHVSTGLEALDLLTNYPYDLAILDWQLPDVSGVEICQIARARGASVPVLMLTAHDSSKDKVQGLDCGADDYLVKPCCLDELLARLRALLRRQPGQQGSASTLRAGGLRLEIASHKVFLHDREVSLSRTEFALLEFLMRHKGQIFDADALLSRVWSSESEVSKDLVKAYVSRLRAKLTPDGQAPVIVTVHGVGYRLEDA